MAESRDTAADLTQLSRSAAQELRRNVHAAVTEPMTAFVKKTPGLLRERASETARENDLREYKDLARRLEAEGDQWIKRFVTTVDRELIGGLPIDAEEFREGHDDSIGTAKTLLAAEAQFHKAMTELDARLNRIRLTLYVPIHTKALAPTGLYRALQDTAFTMKWPARRSTMLTEQFEALFLPTLETMYPALIAELRKIGSGAARVAPLDEPQDDAKPRAPKKPGHIEAPQDSASVDPKTRNMLRHFALVDTNDDAPGYNDGLLASDLLALMDHRPLPGMNPDDGTEISLQRISLAGHFLNEVTTDPLIAEELRDKHESMRMPLVKSALADSSVFTEASHPLSSLINEMMTKSATWRLTDNRETRRVAELLQQVLVQFDLSPEFVREAMERSEPLEQTQIDRFFSLQRKHAEERRDFVIAEARRVVASELEQQTFGRDLPESVKRFIDKSWGPLLTKRLLQRGAADPRWTKVLSMTEHLVDLIEERVSRGDPAQDAEWKSLVQKMRLTLFEAGLKPPGLDQAIDLLQSARAEGC